MSNCPYCNNIGQNKEHDMLGWIHKGRNRRYLV